MTDDQALPVPDNIGVIPGEQEDVAGYGAIPVVEAVARYDAPSQVRVYIAGHAFDRLTPPQERPDETAVRVEYETDGRTTAKEQTVPTSDYGPRLSEDLMAELDPILRSADAAVVRDQSLLPDTYLQEYNTAFDVQGSGRQITADDDGNMFRYRIGGDGGRTGLGFGSHCTAAEELFRADEDVPGADETWPPKDFGLF